MDHGPDPLDGLFVVAPDEFVAARNALVKRLRAAGERERAAEVAALRRPSVPDWALNVVAHERGAELTPFLEAAEQSRQAQRAAASGREGVDLRGALQGLRSASEAVVRAAVRGAKEAGKATGSLTAPLSARLQEVAASAGLADQLRHGRLGTGDAEPDDLFDGDEPPARSRPSGGRRSARRSAAPPAESTPAPPAAPDTRRLRQLDNEVSAARRAHDDAEAAQDAAKARLAVAERGVADAEQVVAEAEEALARARAEHAVAGDDHARAVATLDEARQRLAEVEAEVGRTNEPPE